MDLARSYEGKEQQYFRNVRSEILPLLPPVMDRVLEIGCGGGYTLEYLQRAGRCSRTLGVELFPDAAHNARQRVDEVYEGNIEQLQLPISPESLDAVLCLDVLEHLIDPWRVVQKIHSLIKPGGILVASIPNVRHYTVVLPLLLKGRWDYTPSGLLDRTHLRFFTKASAIALLESSGLRVDAIDAVWRTSRAVRVLDAVTFSLGRPWLEYQFLLRARKVGITTESRLVSPTHEQDDGDGPE
jgi:2-polyprenyl-3-methyl-5-hydroxy-6-metoxy-1,4-benzoquinol methylase